jgi:Sec-independent protein secretion pathway components
MIDLGISKLALIGAVALIVIGPEKASARRSHCGGLAGQGAALRLRREGRSQSFHGARRAQEDERLRDRGRSRYGIFGAEWCQRFREIVVRCHSRVGRCVQFLRQQRRAGIAGAPVYKHPKKNWRLKQGAMPQWYKARAGVRTRTQSGAARVARFRPRSNSAPR